MPVTKDGTFFAYRGGRAQLNHEDEGGSDGDRGDRVKDDAERAAVGVRLERMDVCDLNNSEESQQDEAQNRRRHSRAWPGEEGLAASWMGSIQGCTPFP